MSKLKRFNKSNKKRNTIKLIVAFLLVAVMSAVISYAVYQKEDEVLFINARVGQFETSSSDIELAIKLDGVDVDVPPKKDDGFYNITIECDYADGMWNYNKWLAEIKNITSNKVKCNVNFETTSSLPLNIVELGDYIKMTPTSTSYTISSSLTGYSSNQTINPSELNLWRVISKNADGTVDVVSEHVSSNKIYFNGQTGYRNFVGNLNTIASQYTNARYVKATRHMGYTGQTLQCTKNMTILTEQDCPRYIGYARDAFLVFNALGNLASTTPNNSEAQYWMGYRDVILGWNGEVYYGAGTVSQYGEVRRDFLICVTYTGEETLYDIGYSVRPIVTLKSDISFSQGTGETEDTAFQLS